MYLDQGLGLAADAMDVLVETPRLAKVIERLKPQRVFLDVTSLGAGVYDRLRELGLMSRAGIIRAASG